jgi:hypothetical protein
MRSYYGTSSRDYLARAKHCLKESDRSFLFYAAFEIRCGVEARMQEYLEVQEHISKKKRQGWKVAQLARNIEDAFRIGQKDAVVLVRDPVSKEVLLEVRYTPVKKSLHKRSETLGNYLHSAKKLHPSDSPFWDQFRRELELAVAELEHANSGNLLGPMLLCPNGEIDMKLELPNNEASQWAKKLLFKGAQKVLEVRYE